MKIWLRISYLLIGLLLVCFSIWNFLGTVKSGLLEDNSSVFFVAYAYFVPMFIGIAFILIGFKLLFANKFSYVVLLLSLFAAFVQVVLLISLYVGFEKWAPGLSEIIGYGLFGWLPIYFLLCQILITIALARSVYQRLSLKNKAIKLALCAIVIIAYYLLLSLCFSVSYNFLQSIEWGWKTYTDNTYGFELKYPPYGRLRESGAVIDFPGVNLIDRNPDHPGIYDKGLYVSDPSQCIYDNIIIVNGQKLGSTDHSAAEKVKINGNDFYKTTGNYCDVNGACAIYENYYPLDNSVCFSIQLRYQRVVAIRGEPIEIRPYTDTQLAETKKLNSISRILQALSTVKFINSNPSQSNSENSAVNNVASDINQDNRVNSASTYTNTEYGFSIQYPLVWVKDENIMNSGGASFCPPELQEVGNSINTCKVEKTYGGSINPKAPIVLWQCAINRIGAHDGCDWFNGNNDGTKSLVVDANKHYFYLLTLYDIKYKSIYDKMFPTFKFAK